MYIYKEYHLFLQTLCSDAGKTFVHIIHGGEFMAWI